MGGADKGDDIRQGRKILMQPTALDRIQLTFPASDSAMLVLRMTTVGVLAQVGLALDVVDGIKLAVDEAARQFVTCAREKQLSASFAQAEDGLHITIGVHRKDWNDEDYYPAYVEYGHGGPAPAPAHPYVRPAFDTRQDEAFGIIRDGLLNELRK